MPFIDTARAPDGVRLYAIGDIHGRLDLLRQQHEWIEADLERRPVADWRLVHVGDYVDRGRESAGVIDLLHARSSDGRVICLKGNHDAMFADFLTDPENDAELWLTNGGITTLESYGMDREEIYRAYYRGTLRDAALTLVPQSHVAFLDGLELGASSGDYLFVHAGIAPGVPLEEQDPEDLMWIRGRFLDNERDFGVIVVHGHTIRKDGPEVKRNRIGIDTGAFNTERLSCVVLEGGDKGLLTPDGPEPLKLP